MLSCLAFRKTVLCCGALLLCLLSASCGIEKAFDAYRTALELKQQEQQKTNAKAFVAAVKKYTDMQELDAAVLREFIDRIEVSHADKKSKTREITIVYNFIGAFDFTRAIEEANNTTQKQQKTA